MYPSRSRQALRLIITIVAIGVAVMAAILVIEQIGQPSSAPEPRQLPPTYPALPSPGSPARPSTPASSQSQSQDMPVSGPLQLVQGSRQINGVELGWPHTTVGAVSAATSFTVEIGSTLDPDRAAAITRLAADPEVSDAPQQAAQGALNDRKQLGVTAVGPVPNGTSIASEPVEYQLRAVTPDKVLVLLLCDTVTTQPSTGTQSSYGVVPVQATWTGGDWLMDPPAGGTYGNLAAEPDSPQASTLGWRDLQQTEG